MENCRTLRQAEIDWLISHGSSPTAIIKPSPIHAAHGRRAHDGIFEFREGDDRETSDQNSAWFVFETEHDRVYWQPRTGSIATDFNQVFALGEQLIDDAGTCALGDRLKIFENPLRWLQHDRLGLFIVDWKRAFDGLRHVPRVTVDEKILEKYRRAMKPKVPEVFVFLQGNVVILNTRRSAS